MHSPQQSHEADHGSRDDTGQSPSRPRRSEETYNTDGSPNPSPSPGLSREGDGNSQSSSTASVGGPVVTSQNTTANSNYIATAAAGARPIPARPSASSLNTMTLDHSDTSSAGWMRNGTNPFQSMQRGNSSSPLPADDGMQLLRQQMHQIRDMVLSTEEKAQRMHRLMVAEYQRLRIRQVQKETNDYEARGRPLARSSSSHGLASSRDPTVSASGLTLSRSLRSEELEPTYHLHDRPSGTQDDTTDSDSDSEGPPLGCEHYMRNIKVQCPQCERFYTCRHCHDAVEDHTLVRKNILNILCMLCGLPQRAAEYCRQCEEQTACYYCEVCKLWDNDPTKTIYHCPDCGICRRGEGIGKDYIHCIRCNVCVSIQHAQDHRCVERATDCDCPICEEYMFSSSSAVVAMKCGHYIHRNCYDDLMNTTYKCPICNRSAVNMELQWRKMDDCLESQPMPEQYRDTQAWIICNDCHMRSCVPFHWLGNKCRMCDSYNTNQVSLVNEPKESTVIASNVEAEQHQVAQAAGLPHPSTASLTGNRSGTQSGLLTAGDDIERPHTPLGDLALSIDDDNAGEAPAQPAQGAPLNHRRFRAALRSPPSPLDPDQYMGAPRARRPRRHSESSASAPASIYSEADDEMGFWGAGINPGDYMPSMPQMPNMPQMPSMPSLPRMPSVSIPSMPAGWRSPSLFATAEQDIQPPQDGEQRGWGFDPRQWRLGSPTDYFRTQSPLADIALSDDELALEADVENRDQSSFASHIGWDPRRWRLPTSPRFFSDRDALLDDAPDAAVADAEAGNGWGIDPRQWSFANQGIFGRSRSVDTAILHTSTAGECSTTGTSPSSIWNLQPRSYLARRFGSFSIHGNSDGAESKSEDEDSEGSGEEEEDSRDVSDDDEESDEAASSSSERGEGETDEDQWDLVGHR